MPTILIGHRQVGNGDIAIKNGKHPSQKKKASGGGGGGGGSAPVAPDGVSLKQQVFDKGTPYEYSRREYSFNADGNEVSVLIRESSGSGPRDVHVDFFVNGSVIAGSISPSASKAITSKVGSIFKADIASRPNNTRYDTTAFTGDSRAGFREAMYARAGFSLGDGVKSSPGQYQNGVVRNGRLIPSTRDGKPFTASQQKAHAAATRAALLAGIKAAKNSR